MGILLWFTIFLSHSVETVICHGSESTYRCDDYHGGDYLEFSYGQQELLEDVITLHEFDGIDLANPYPDLEPETSYLPTYSPWVNENQIPQIFLDPQWSNPDAEPWQMVFQ